MFENYPNALSHTQLVRVWMLELYSAHHSKGFGEWKSKYMQMNGTCSCVSSSVPNILESPQGQGLVVVCVQLKLRLDLVTVLHKWDLKGKAVWWWGKSALFMLQFSYDSSSCRMRKRSGLDLMKYYKHFIANIITLTTIVSLNSWISDLHKSVSNW